MEKYPTWREFLIEKLTNPEKALGYLQVYLEDYLIDGDTPFFLKGVRNVVQTQGGIPKVAKQAGIDPETLSDFLSSEDPLNLNIFCTILKVFGWQLSIEPLAAKAKDQSDEVTSQKLTKSDETLKASTPQVAETSPT